MDKYNVVRAEPRYNGGLSCTSGIFLTFAKVDETRERRSFDGARENSVSFVRMKTSRLSPRRDEITEVSLEISISGLAPLTPRRNLRE